MARVIKFEHKRIILLYHEFLGLQEGAWKLETIVTHDQLGAKADRLAEKVQTLTISSEEENNIDS